MALHFLQAAICATQGWQDSLAMALRALRDNEN
jgi:hypothetical protein